MAEVLCDLLFADDDVVNGELLQHPADADDLFGILQEWEDCVSGGSVEAALSSAADAATPTSVAAKGNKRRSPQGRCDDSVLVQEPAKKQRCSPPAVAVVAATTGEGGATKTATTSHSHIAVERNRRKQMNEHLAVLRSLMPCFYVKRGDQASIIGGVVNYIKELQQLLQSLEAKKQRKAYADQLVLNPRRPLPLKSTPPMSPRPAVPIISPRTKPTSSSPYSTLRRQPSLPLLHLPLPLPPPRGSSAYESPAMTPTSQESAASSSSSSSYLPSLDAIAAELCAYTANSKQATASGGAVVLPEVKVEFSGANLVVKTASQRAPGQAVKVIAALEGRSSLEILHAKISTVDDTAVNSFTIKIGIECGLSAEELVQEIQQCF